MNAKCTLGPWNLLDEGRLSPAGDADIVYDIIGPSSPYRNGFVGTFDAGTFTKTETESQTEARANARLIAAAPELLEAAQAALTAIRDLPKGINSLELQAAYLKLRSALDKAEEQ